ncbi:hypothetical protein EVAR_37018_1 [Eumeta japonica]|uniref:Uncharacterized protein n=1 Tax=Eumeta variegata TaxID=151549 RepID=A0A4C1X1E0_EUMVA|nr:hypothetical protein EVAR_37018_1 [Eumeta japonica]
MSIRCLRRATRGRARSRACAQRQGGGHRAVKRRLTRAGRAQLNPHTQATAARRIPMNADRVEAARTGDPAAAAEAARVSEPLPPSSYSSSSGPRQEGLSDRRGAPRSIGSQLK